MQNILSTLDELRALSGNAQLAQLEIRKSELLKEILEYTYNPHKMYKIDEGKYNKFDNKENAIRCNFDIDDWNYFKRKLDYLCSIKSAKDEDVENMVFFINDFDDNYRDFLKKILFKDLRLNMSIKKFQKVWPGFCEEPQVQLANKREDQIFENGLYSRKFDGKRMYIMNGVPNSRANKQCSIAPVQHILNQANEMLSNSENIVLDGECLYFENGTEDFQKGISLCQSDERREGCDNICYVIFDTVPESNFVSKTPYKPFKEVYEDMITKYANLEKSSPDYSLIPTNFNNIFIARQDSDMSCLAELARKNNWEGLMYRNGDSPYEYKRSKNLLKIKKMEDIELKLIGMEEGTGRHAGRLGAFVVEYEGHTVNIGSGFSDEQRVEYWNNKEKYIGEYVKTQYFEKTVNQEGKPSLRFPVFVSFRNLETSDEFLIK